MEKLLTKQKTNEKRKIVALTDALKKTHHMNILVEDILDMWAAVTVALAVYHQNSSFQKSEMGSGRVLI